MTEVPKSVVRCMFCNKPMKIDKFGALFTKKEGGMGMSCNETPCIISYIEYHKKEAKSDDR
jgi:hypothetical protein